MDNKNYFFTLNNVILKRIILYVCVGGGGGAEIARARLWCISWDGNELISHLSKEMLSNDSSQVSNIISIITSYRKEMSRDMWFPTMWHFDKCRLGPASF